MSSTIRLWVLLGAVAGVLVGAVWAAAYALSYLSNTPISMIISPPALPIKAPYWAWAIVESIVAFFAIFATLALITYFIKAR